MCMIRQIFPHALHHLRGIRWKFCHVKKRLNGPPDNNLVIAFNEILHPTSSTIPQSDSIPSIHPHQPTANLNTVGHSTDDENSISDDEMSLANSSDEDDDNINEPFIASHDQQYSDIGDSVWECPFCQACIWYQERK
ncbi:unnamed protein product [Lathyrus sativus]|nr:unnamed protein product [Lathyrus sativus]